MKQKLEFERLELTKEQALDLFSYNKFKTYLIESKIADGAETSVYRIGDFVDLCTGPHLPHTGHVKVVSLVKNSSAYWLGSAENESLQRIYGISFQDKAQMKAYKQ